MAIYNVYHGTNQEFSQFSQDKAKITNDYYGGGAAYFTPDLSVARIYAKTAVKKSGGKEIIYRAQLSLNKVFDVDQHYTGKELISILPTNLEQFARGAGLLNFGADRFEVLASLKDGTASLTGGQIFKGLSSGMINTAKARETLKKRKFDGLRYNPVLHANRTPHEVYIAYEARNIRITGKYGQEAEKQDA